MDFGTKLSTDTVGLWLWPLLALIVLRIVKGADPRWWLAAGAVLGIAMGSKYTIAFLAGGIVAGLLVLPNAARWRRRGLPQACSSQPLLRCRTSHGRRPTVIR